jgi:hypothetical protein
MNEEEVFCCRLRRSFMCHQEKVYMQNWFFIAVGAIKLQFMGPGCWTVC